MPSFKVSIVYPSQPASMMTVEVQRDSTGRIIHQEPVTANDDDVAGTYGAALATLPAGYTFADSPDNPSYGASTSRGRYGLGETFAFLKTVRPYRRVFESRSVFRLRFDSIAVMYERDPTTTVTVVDAANDSHTSTAPAAPFLSYEDHDDQMLDLPVAVIERQPTEYRLMLSATGNANDFLNNYLVVPVNGGGTWDVNTRVELSPAGNNWIEGHQVELRLYRNGLLDRVIGSHTVANSGSSGDILVSAVADTG